MDRFDVKVDRSGECHLWMGARLPKGYGRFWDGRRAVYAHRFAYERAKGPIPDGLCIDHLCRTPACVNPEHLEAVTLRENVVRGDTIIAREVAATHCYYGHPLDGRRSNGRRYCKRCHREREADRKARMRAA